MVNISATNDWQIRKLGQMADEVRDLFEPKNAERLSYIGLEHIEQGTLQLSGVGSSTDTVSTKKKFNEGEILFGSLRPYFRKVVRPRFCGVCSTDITVIKPKPNTCPGFIHYFIASEPFIAHASNISTGTRMPRANWKTLCQSEWLFPPLPTQRKIAAILSAYDDLIENNLRRIKILEAMAQNLYREWFVKFRFPGHQNARFVDSSLGRIPEGWEVKNMPDAVIIRPSLPVPKNGQIPFVSMGSLSETSMLISEIEYRPKASGSRFQNGDTLFARITSCLENGKTGFVQFLPSDATIACGSTEFIVLRSRTLCPEYVYLMARSDLFRDNAIKSMSGATGRQRVREECFSQFLLAQPSATIIEHFQMISRPQFDMIYSLNRKNQNLRRTRALLLPKLISGEVDVSALDIAVTEEAA